MIILRDNHAALKRFQRMWRRFAVARAGRRNFRLSSEAPYISFTFDDFPRSALFEGGRILAEQGVRGTYFVSLKLLGSASPSGPIASQEDLTTLLHEGHQLGCHTYDHLDGCNVDIEVFEESIQANRRAFLEIVAAGDLPVFAYPLNGPVLRIKRAVGKHFVACRGGKQRFNSGVIDLNLLNAFFLDKRNRSNLDAVRKVISQNAASRGWLIFATHDVAAEPSAYGCEPGYFEEVVRLSRQSGARVVPMMTACQELGIAE